ncbi:amino-acid N-acetyltransferase [Motiliproteus coralliicola]|uniref:amino-acid N-acetyltransferase n=1 Tax=Motiliproteus coralliicola TaxID=2283196 RepID=UPI001FB53E2F|nr:amino-acid N-acetyltransferase [Motiliproteus coralliicola]
MSQVSASIANSSANPSAKSNTNANYVEFFRHCSPYINGHRGKTLVLLLDGDALTDGKFNNIANDLALLNSLGLRLVIVHGGRPQIESQLAQRGIKSQLHRHLRITDGPTLECVKEVIGGLRTDIEARLSMGLPNSPMHGAKLRVCSGNFIAAKPLGVVDGVDYCHTGEVRRVDSSSINHLLDQGSMVLLSNLGYSPTGEVFNLAIEDVAAQVAIALKADKLICFGEDNGIVHDSGQQHSELLTKAAERLLQQYLDGLTDSQQPHSQLARQLTAVTTACHGGVDRGHLISYHQDGALLLELFTRDGTGTMVLQESYEQVRQAGIDDVGGILELIRPLEERGVLVRRSRELLETEIDRFVLVERDNSIIGCAALYPYQDGSAELACVAVSDDYRGGNRGDRMLSQIEQQARAQGIERLFVLTTRTAHWFQERGFVEADLSTLPKGKQALYNLQRNSKVFEKNLG